MKMGDRRDSGGRFPGRADARAVRFGLPQGVTLGRETASLSLHPSPCSGHRQPLGRGSRLD